MDISIVQRTNGQSVQKTKGSSVPSWRPGRLVAAVAAGSIAALLIVADPGAAGAGQTAQVKTPNPWTMCAKATNRVERERKIPRQLLRAISKAESGRFNKERQAVMAWPWTVMAEGRGRYLDTKAEAIAEVEGLRARGVRNIDVGCMQINLMHHPDAFASLDEAFDPLTNVRYAASFLKTMAANQGSWAKAAAYYHSQTPARYRVYRSKVRQIWAQEREKYLLALDRFRAEQQAALGLASLMRIDMPIPADRNPPTPATEPDLAIDPRGDDTVASTALVIEAPLIRADGIDMAEPVSEVGFRRAGPVRTTILAQSM